MKFIIIIILTVTLAMSVSPFLEQAFGQSYEDDFSDQSSAGWAELPGGWLVREGTYQGRYACAIFTEPGEVEGDFVFQIDAQIIQEEDDPGGADHIQLMTNAQFDPETGIFPAEYYAITVRQNGLRDVYIQRQPSGHFVASRGFRLDPKLDVHTYRVEREDATLRFYVDDQLLLEYTDNAPYEGGYIGIRDSTPLLYWDNMSLETEEDDYEDNFEDENHEGWTELPGGWQSRGGRYQGRYARSIYTESGEVDGDFFFQIEAQIMEEEDDQGGADHIILMTNAQFDPETRITPTEYYSFTVRQNGLRDVYIQRQPSGHFVASRNFVLEPKLGVHTYRVEREDATLRFYVDDEQLLEYTDDESYEGGFAGIWGSNPMLYWDNMHLELTEEHDPQVIHVPGDFETIQAAINAAWDGDSIIVDPGEYVENIDFLGKNIVIMGNPDDPSETIIDGDRNDSVVSFQNGESEDAVITGFTLTNGIGWFHGGYTNGGGIVLNGSSPTISHCIIKDNEVGWGGGGIFCGSSSPTVTNCLIIDNSAGHEGGGIMVHAGSDATIINCTFSGNVSGTWQGGGGIYLHGNSHATVVNSVLWHNYRNGNEQEIWFCSIGERCELTISYTDVEGGRDGIVTNNNGDVNWGEGNIDEDPLFADPDEDDYQLTADSPCIDSGTALFVWEEDTLINLSEDEYAGEAPDMGAFEYGFVAVDPEGIHPPLSFRLLPPRPNPFNSTTSIRYSLDRDAFITLKLYDLAGREVAGLVNERQAAGNHQTIWNAVAFPSGVYICRMEAADYVRSIKITLMK